MIIISAIVGLVSGAIGSLIAPWVHWRVEKRRTQLNAQRTLIADARAELQRKPGRDEFQDSAVYSRLLPHLSEHTRERIESDTITIQSGGRGGGVNNFIPLVLDDIRELETKWKLL